MNFDSLIHSIADVHTQLQAQAAKAVNLSLTLRNWVIGGYIAEYELRGEDRAVYGAKLFPKLAARLQKLGLSGVNARELPRFRLLYHAYPQILGSLTPQFKSLLPATTNISGSATPKLAIPADKLLSRLSYTHLALLVEIDDPLKRTFYEIESIKGCWSVRELKRQIGTLYFERSGLSRNKEALSRMANEASEEQTPSLIIRDPFVFDFLGLSSSETLSESELEAALMKHLQSFLLELGRGFCFEAQQKRLLIGGEYFFCDLVFYHRILKCHVLIELKTEAFSHEHLGQLNAYVAYYREHEMQPGDQPPVGILLCTQQNQALVKYALAGMDQSLFVSRYQMQLPEAKELEAFLQRELKLWEEQHA